MSYTDTLPAPANPARGRDSFLNAICVGSVVAFRSDSAMLSGKVVQVFNDKKKNCFVVRTKNGSIFCVSRPNITWVKLGTNWPTGIYNALKYYKESPGGK